MWSHASMDFEGWVIHTVAYITRRGWVLRILGPSCCPSKRLHLASAGTFTLVTMIVVSLVSGCGTAGTSTSPSTPVSGPDWGTMGLTSSTGTGNATVQGLITYRGTAPTTSVLVNLMDSSGKGVTEAYAQDHFTFGGLTPGSYRLAVYALQTGYISQWYGGLPVQTHPASDSQLLEVGPGTTQVDFVLEPGRSIQGHVTWSGDTSRAGWVWAYDSSGKDTGHSAGLAASDHLYIIVGLVPGYYRVGASADDPQLGPQVWYGGDHSAEKATLIDVTEKDASHIDIDLGVLSPTTIPVSPTTTIP